MVQRRGPGRTDQFPDSVGAFPAYDEQLDRVRILGEVGPAVAMDGGRSHVHVGVAALPLRQAAVDLGLRQLLAVRSGEVVMNVDIQGLPRGYHAKRSPAQAGL